MVVSSGWRLPAATQPGTAAAVEGGLDGDGGVARAVEPQGLTVTRQGRVAGDDPGEVVCGPQHWLEGNSRPHTLAQSSGAQAKGWRNFFRLFLIYLLYGNLVSPVAADVLAGALEFCCSLTAFFTHIMETYINNNNTYVVSQI